MNNLSNQKKFNEFIEERNNMLAKNSIEELEKYFKKWASKEEYEKFKAAKPFVKRATLYKMICAIDAFKGTELGNFADEWLTSHNMEKLHLIEPK